MKPLAHHIAAVRAKPHHVRKQVAFAIALAITAVIALLWLVLSLATGSFRTQGASFADAANRSQASGAPASTSSLLGAAAAAFAGSTTPAQLEVVQTADTAAPQAPANSQTVIPF